MAMKESTKAIFNYVKENDGKDFTAADIAEALGMEVRSVNGSLTGMQKKGWIVREVGEAEVTNEDGKVTHKEIKLIRLTATGRDADPDAE